MIVDKHFINNNQLSVSRVAESRFVSRNKTREKGTGAFIAYLLSALTSINGTDDNDLRLAAFRPVPSGTSRIPPLRFSI